ncbi:hypothetical protein [Streptomyces sp. YS415]|uniref:hypothetical protein n=1 Tax=Streptomyces sp. YS415 TaxID=2944806 RepID=UPI00202197CD|nr:hypothetical protein [Streptomyces sp. YS415]MCL7427157.1 hypothetical protein [Streptomyces sp. YS415]
MSLLSTRVAAVGIAAGAAFTLLASATAAEARPDAFHVSLQPNSNVRTAPNTQSQVRVNTGPTVDRFEMYGICYVYGETVTAGGYTTAVWYAGNIYDSQGGQYNGYYVWGGNVNVGTDPADSVDPCF